MGVVGLVSRYSPRPSFLRDVPPINTLIPKPFSPPYGFPPNTLPIISFTFNTASGFGRILLEYRPPAFGIETSRAAAWRAAFAFASLGCALANCFNKWRYS